jgi:hypothetical protein
MGTVVQEGTEHAAEVLAKELSNLGCAFAEFLMQKPMFSYGNGPRLREEWRQWKPILSQHLSCRLATVIGNCIESHPQISSPQPCPQDNTQFSACPCHVAVGKQGHA